MPIEISLSPLQIKQIASSIDLKDIKEYVENHKEEYEQFLEEQEKKRKRQYNQKIYTFWNSTKSPKIRHAKDLQFFKLYYMEYKK